MPRKNRQKHHRSLRLAAEARAAVHARRRRERQEAVRAGRLSAEAVLAGVARPDPRVVDPASGFGRSLSDLMRLAHVPAGRQRRVLRLVALLVDRAPALVRVGLLPWYLLIAQQPWVRDPAAWSAPGGSERRKRDALANWLLARFPVPPFLLRALDVCEIPVARVPVEDEWAVGLLAWVGRGKPLRQLSGTPELPTPLTRRMCHLFLRARAATSPVEALRQAQVRGLGGDRSLADALVQTRLGRLRGGDARTGEVFWHGVLAWIVARPALGALAAPELDRVLAWIEAEVREAAVASKSWSLKGRTPDSVFRETDAWWALQAPAMHEAFPDSGLVPVVSTGWSWHPLRTPAEVRIEATVMRNCAAHYVGLLRRGKVALWSLRRGRRQHATVEVALGAGRVVQAKGRLNAPIDAEGRSRLGEWAAHNRLTVADAL